MCSFLIQPPKKELARTKLTTPGLGELADAKPSQPPIPRGTYNLDLDDLNSMDPFKSTKATANSPTKDKPQMDSAFGTESVGDVRFSPPASPSKQDEFVDAKVGSTICIIIAFCVLYLSFRLDHVRVKTVG